MDFQKPRTSKRADEPALFELYNGVTMIFYNDFNELSIDITNYNSFYC